MVVDARRSKRDLWSDPSTKQTTAAAYLNPFKGYELFRQKRKEGQAGGEVPTQHLYRYRTVQANQRAAK